MTESDLRGEAHQGAPAPGPAPATGPGGPPGKANRAGDAARRAGRALARRWSDPRLKWPKRLALATAACLVVPVVTAGVGLRLLYAGDPGPDTHTRGRDAVWLGHAWVDGRNGERELAELVRRVRGTGVRDLYVHAGPLEHDGTLPASGRPGAEWLLKAVHRELPGVRVQAWLGDVLATEGPPGMVLEDDETRAHVVRSARQILDAGFEGVHFDLEPLHSGDGAYLALLDAVHAVARAHRAPLSVAAHQIDPLPALHSVAGALAGHPKWWSQDFFGDVARRVDQIAVMSYDTAMPLESLYGGYVAHQTQLALEVTPAATDLLIGLPAFHEDDIGHRESAETVHAAVRGARLGLSRADRHRERFGVALYVDYAATDGDWAAYEKGWGAAGGLVAATVPPTRGTG